MPSFTKFCSRLLRLRRPTNTAKIDTPPPPSLATTLPDKTPSIVSDAETERMTEVIEDSPESGYQHSSNHWHESSSGRVYPQKEHVDNASQANRRFRNSACRTHGLLTPHASTGDAHAEESESQDTVIIVKRKFEEAIAQAEEQPSRTGSREDITARFLNPTNFSPSEADAHNLYASVGIQTSRSYASSWASSSSSIVSRPTRLLNASNPETPVRSPNRTNSGTRTQTIAGSPGPKGPPKRNRTRRHTRSPSPSPASRAAHQSRPAQALSDDTTHIVKRKRSFILEGEREQQAVLDDLRYLRTERDRLYAELRRVMQLEKDHTSLFWRPDAPVDLGENDGARPEDTIQEPELEGATQSGNRPVDANANVETDSLDYVTPTSEEERRVQSQHEQRLATLVQDTENLAKQSEALASQPESATQTSVHSQPPPQTSDDVPFPLPNNRDTSGGRLHDEATPLRQGQRSPYRNATAPAWPAHLFTSPTRSLGRSSLQASASTPTSNGLGPGFTYGEGTVSDQASFNFIHGRSTLSMHSLEDEFEPPPVRDPDTYFIWFDLETNDAVRPASHTRILEVAVCVTDRNFIRLDNGVSYLVHWPFDAKYIASEMPEKVRTMHETSGLLRAYADTPQEKRLTLQQVEQYVCRYLKKHDIQPTGRGIMAGAGIAFDRGMVRQHMKTLDKYFGHQIFDTSSVWQLVKRKYNRGQRFQERCAHRALEDIYGSMREAKMFSETVLKAPRDVSWPSSSRRN